MKTVKIGWLSGGISSLIACYLERETIDFFVYIHLEDSHIDTMRFIRDCEKLLNTKVIILKSKRYKNVNNVILANKIIKNPFNQFAPCTTYLKKEVRKQQLEKPLKSYGYEITYVWGYDYQEKNRAIIMLDNEISVKHYFPLIENKISKKECHGIFSKFNIDMPIMYKLGYSNNNCIGCVKGGKGYWNKIRKDFPEVFKQRQEMELIIGASCIKGTFLFELNENEGNFNTEIIPECGIFCQTT